MAKRKKDFTAGLFLIDLKALKLSTEQLAKIDLALQETVQRELAAVSDLEGISGSPLGPGIRGFFAE